MATGKFGDCSFSRFGPRAGKILIDTQTDTQRDEDERFTPATLGGVSNDDFLTGYWTVTFRSQWMDEFPVNVFCYDRILFL